MSSMFPQPRQNPQAILLYTSENSMQHAFENSATNSLRSTDLAASWWSATKPRSGPLDMSVLFLDGLLPLLIMIHDSTKSTSFRKLRNPFLVAKGQPLNPATQCCGNLGISWGIFSANIRGSNSGSVGRTAAPGRWTSCPRALSENPRRSVPHIYITVHMLHINMIIHDIAVSTDIGIYIYKYMSIDRQTDR
jgi:hypothetical protein